MLVRRSLLVAAGIAVCLAAAAADEPGKETKPYRIVDGRVDMATYRGWRAYHSACHACHGADGVGSNVAPNLLERVKALSARDFSIKVLTSYRIVLESGEVRGDDSTAVREAFVQEVLRRERGELVMPAWEGDPKVRPHLLDLYAYLKARSDGALGPGRPQQIPE